MLSQKQEKFVEELIKGKSQREAYREAYGCEGWKPESIDNKASKLYQKDEVKARYQEMIKGSLAKTGHDAETMRAFIIEKLQQIASGEICDETIEYDADNNVLRRKRTVKASDRKDALNKLAEYYNVTPDVSVQHEVNVTFVDSLKEYCE